MGFKLTTLVVIGTDCTGSCKSNYHMIPITRIFMLQSENTCITIFNLVKIMYMRSSTEISHFVRIQSKTWLPWSILDSDWLKVTKNYIQKLSFTDFQLHTNDLYVNKILF